MCIHSCWLPKLHLHQLLQAGGLPPVKLSCLLHKQLLLRFTILAGHFLQAPQKCVVQAISDLTPPKSWQCTPKIEQLLPGLLLMQGLG